jgi:hypothetical protein
MVGPGVEIGVAAISLSTGQVGRSWGSTLTHRRTSLKYESFRSVEEADRSDRRQTELVPTSDQRLTVGFARTIRHIFLHNPLTILVPDTAISQGGPLDHRGDTELECSVMVEKLEQVFDLECVPMPRSHWNRETGR